MSPESMRRNSYYQCCDLKNVAPTLSFSFLYYKMTIITISELQGLWTLKLGNLHEMLNS